MPSYLFDVKLFAAIRVDAPDEATALALLKECEEAATWTVYPLGHPCITCEASFDGDPDLVEVDGEAQ